MRFSAKHFSIHICLLLTVLWAGLSDSVDAQSVWSQCHKAGFAGDTNLCASDRPCFTELFQEGSSIHVAWDGMQSYDLYHVIAGEPGQRVGQADVGGGRSGSYQINNVRPCATFVIKVQGCNTHFLGHADCSPWTETTFQVA